MQYNFGNKAGGLNYTVKNSRVLVKLDTLSCADWYFFLMDYSVVIGLHWVCRFYMYNNISTVAFNIYNIFTGNSCHCTRNPCFNGSSGLTITLHSWVIHALPVISGTMIIFPLTFSEEIILHLNLDPITDSLVYWPFTSSFPSWTSSAALAAVPVPHGDLSKLFPAKVTIAR